MFYENVQLFSSLFLFHSYFLLLPLPSLLFLLGSGLIEDVDKGEFSLQQSPPIATSFIVGKKIEDYLRFLTHAGETRFPIFA